MEDERDMYVPTSHIEGGGGTIQALLAFLLEHPQVTWVVAVPLICTLLLHLYIAREM